MKIRPLHKFEGGYISDDGNYLMMEIGGREWFSYQRNPDSTYYDQPIFYESFPTLKSLIKTIELSQ